MATLQSRSHRARPPSTHDAWRFDIGASAPPRWLGLPRSAWRGTRLPAVLALAGLAAIPFDLPLARWFLDGHCPGAVNKLLLLSEAFAHGYGVLVILAAVALLDPPRRVTLPRLLMCSLGAGLFSNVFKLLLSRTRPGNFDFAGDVSQTFQQALPLLNSGVHGQGFPSSHVATACGVAMALSWLYPRGRWLFAFLVVLAGLQRMASGAHFMSDVLWGAAAGTLAAAAFLPGGLLAGMFERLEARRSLSAGR